MLYCSIRFQFSLLFHFSIRPPALAVRIKLNGAISDERDINNKSLRANENNNKKKQPREPRVEKKKPSLTAIHVPLLSMTTHSIHGDAVNHQRMNRRCDVAPTATATTTATAAEAVAAHATVRPISLRTWHTKIEQGERGEGLESSKAHVLHGLLPHQAAKTCASCR